MSVRPFIRPFDCVSDNESCEIIDGVVVIVVAVAYTIVDCRLESLVYFWDRAEE